MKISLLKRKNLLVLFSYPATLPTMDGGPLLVNDFLAHSERIYVGEGPESIEVLEGKIGEGEDLNAID